MIDGQSSSIEHVNMGVAQGSKLGPLLYLIFTNDIGKLALKGKIMMFADDIAMLYRSNEPTLLMQDVQHDMALISDYFETNRLVLNLNKSKVMYFGKKSNSTFDNEVIINGNVIERVYMYKYLGLIVDSDLNFNHHVDYVARKLTSIISLIFRVRGFVPRHILIDLLFSLFHSNLLYLIEVYGTASKTTL